MDARLTIDLTGKVALVTGAAKGLGRGAALALAASGADVIVADSDVDSGKRMAEEIRALGRKSLFIPINMMDAEQISVMAVKVEQQFGLLDILVNNVGGGRPVDFLEQSRSSIERHIALNLMSTLIATQSLVPLMCDAGGAIINVASTEALRAAPGFAVYAACKAAIVSFTKSMALELAQYNIRSYALAPDMIDTPGLAPLMNASSDAQKQARDRYIPLGRVGTINEFGHIVAFLASGLASYLNGITIPVDAGATAASGWYRKPDNSWCLYHSD